MKVILGFPNTDGAPFEFEALPEVGELIDWAEGNRPDTYAPDGRYKVDRRHYVRDWTTGSMTPFLTLSDTEVGMPDFEFASARSEVGEDGWPKRN